MYAVVTGAAGFIGSHLAEALCGSGHRVLGIDCFTDYYERSSKRRNIEALESTTSFSLSTADLRSGALETLLDGADVVFHLAGQPGVRQSWSDGFADYCSHNILATQLVLEAAVACRCPRVVYASSSSVYGAAPPQPSLETDLPRPLSPYGVTKLAAEHLCGLYAENFALPTVALRYFTVFGPRQRPDMAIGRIIDAAIHGGTFTLYGSGEQARDFTYVHDVVAATLAAAAADIAPGTVLNIAGGVTTSMTELIDLVGELAGRPVTVERSPAQAGDVNRTGGNTEAARFLLGWSPVTSLHEGLTEQLAWSRRAVGPPHAPPRPADPSAPGQSGG
jgi:nucleoside-diphosphate-sugar epimerase